GGAPSTATRGGGTLDGGGGAPAAEVTMRARVLAAALLALAMAVPLEARPRHRRSSSPYDREGFLIGFSVGAGAIGPDPCPDCGVSAGGEVHLGAMASSYGDVAVMLEAGGVARDDL